MPKPSKRPLPCRRCKFRHLKCDDTTTPCRNCKKSQVECHRASQPFRFKRQSEAGLAFNPRQTWLATEEYGELAYIDLTKQIAGASAKKLSSKNRVHEPEPEAQAESSQDEDNYENDATAQFGEDFVEAQSNPPDRQLNARQSDNLSHEIEPSIQTSVRCGRPADVELSSPPQDQLSNGAFFDRPSPYGLSAPSSSFTQPEAAGPNSHRFPSNSQTELQTSPLSATSISRSIAGTSHPSYAVPSPHYATPDALHGLPEKGTNQAYTDLQESCLVKHFIKNLADVFDATDRDRHFTLVVPQRAMFCPVLLYAILTASARHLTQKWYQCNPGTPVEFEGNRLRDLDDNSAVLYHNICISHLMKVLNDPQQTINQDALIAATILRFHEQIDIPWTGWDSETYMEVLQGVIDATQNKSFYSTKTIQGSSRDLDLYVPYSQSLAHSACLIALRQEIWSALLKRRPFRFPICSDNDYLFLDSAGDDYVWANRILVWCADTCRFCFGEDGGTSTETKGRMEQWQRLRAVQQRWDATQPACFKPLYYNNADPSKGKYFPDEWHTNECQVLGLQHLELSRMLLAAYNPKLQRIGLGARVSLSNLQSTLRRSTLKLCSLALGASSQAAMITAAVGISMSGEYISDSGEQKAILDFLNVLERQHAWPTQTISAALLDAWRSCDQQSEDRSVEGV